MKKYRSIGFWVGIMGVILTATGNEIADFTTWSALGQYVVDVLQNPCTLIGVVMAVYGAWNNPTEKGVK